MSKDFEISEVIKFEGGYVDHKNDSGGATKYGISLRFYKKEINELADKETIFSLTKDEAGRIYEKHFYFKAGCHYLPNGKLRHMIFDQCVNVGIKRAVDRLKVCLSQTFHQSRHFAHESPFFGGEHFENYDFDKIDKEVARKIDVISLGKLDQVLVNNYILESIKYYHRLGKREKFRVFYVGWMNRILRFV